MRGIGDTIFAAASGTGRAAITVLRVTGSGTRACVAAMAGRVPPPRQASLRTLRDLAGETLDHAIVLWFPGPRSYTGEDSAELHLHGGKAILEAVGRHLTILGARPAEPGEFTRRSFLNGKRDLIEAEAIADLVEADTDAQRRQALRQLGGALGTLYRDWIERARALLAREEAAIDFAEEDGGMAALGADPTLLRELSGEIERHLGSEHGQKLRDGVTFVISGPPNVGKSSLMNQLAAEDAAIVAPTPGTTRDVLERRVVFGDVPVTLVDTAGLRETKDPIEQEGVRRGRSRASAADLVLHIDDARSPDPFGDTAPRGFLIANKADLLDGAASPAWAHYAVSARTGAGMEPLRRALGKAATEMTHISGGAPLTRSRHRAALTDAKARLFSAESAVVSELRAEELRLALAALARITGQERADDVLDEVFAQFCIGK